MDAHPETEDLAQATRWLLVVLVGAAVLAAGVIAATNVPGLVGNRWQVVGAVSGAVTVLALVVGLLVVLRSMGPAAEDEGLDAATVNETLPAVTDAGPDEGSGEGELGDDATGDGDGDDDGVEAPTAGESTVDVFVLPPPAPGVEARRAHRRAVQRFHRTRTAVSVAVVVAFLGMVGMTVAAVVDGNNVERRQRTLLEAQLAAEADGPITEPQAVAVQLTTPGLRRVADAMGCTGAQIGARPVQGWAVSGTYRDPTVVLFGPVPQCDDVQLALAPRDGFVYPTFGAPTGAAAGGATTTTTRPPAAAAGGQAQVPAAGTAPPPAASPAAP